MAEIIFPEWETVRYGNNDGGYIKCGNLYCAFRLDKVGCASEEQTYLSIMGNYTKGNRVISDTYAGYPVKYYVVDGYISDGKNRWYQDRIVAECTPNSAPGLKKQKA